MGDVVCLDEYRKKRDTEEVERLQHELDSLIREQLLEEIEQITFQCYNLTDDEITDLGLTDAMSAYYVVVSPWIFYTADDFDS